jgi:long-chain acyl-CoA synthetase
MTDRNLAELFRRQAERLGPRPALRWRRHGLFHDLTWQDYREQVLACAAAVADAGVVPGDRVGLLAENRPEWLVADLAILAAAAVNVPPHAPLTARQVHYQLADAGASWLFVSTAEQLDKVRQVRAELPRLRGVVVFDGRAAGPGAASWAGFLQRGRRALPRLAAELSRREAGLGPDDLATIMYTSGTTGDPKGVMLTHGNLLSNAAACEAASPRGPGAVLLGWLPLSHIYARTIDHYLGIVAGVTLCLGESAETVVRDLGEVQPTHMSGVPRFYEKLMAAVAAADPEETGRRLRAVFGPRAELLCSGGAPLPPALAEAYRRAGVLVLQGYGLTESSPVITFNRKERYKLDTVGQAIPGVEVRVAADGEVLTRGPHVMRGYWNDPAATAEALRGGWLHTGDLGRLDAEGFLTITGRKKELLVLSNGKKVVPSYIEGLLVADPCIDQAVVHGEGRHFLTALLVPHWEKVRAALRAAGVAEAGAAAECLAGHPAVAAFLRQRVDSALAGVSNWERVKKFVVVPRPFTVEGEELTVSLKLRRGVVLARHRAALDALYRDGAAEAG